MIQESDMRPSEAETLPVETSPIPPEMHGLCVCSVEGAQIAYVDTGGVGELRGLLETLTGARRAEEKWPKTVAEYAQFVGKTPHTISVRIRTGLLDAEKREGQHSFITKEQHERYARGLTGLHRERKRK